MKCALCSVSVMATPLVRVNEFGVTGVWWCCACLKAQEPELHSNTVEDYGELFAALSK